MGSWRLCSPREPHRGQAHVVRCSCALLLVVLIETLCKPVAWLSVALTGNTLRQCVRSSAGCFPRYRTWRHTAAATSSAPVLPTLEDSTAGADTEGEQGEHAPPQSALLLPSFQELSDHAEAGRVKKVLSIAERVEDSWPPSQMHLLHQFVVDAYVANGNLIAAARWCGHMQERGLPLSDASFMKLLVQAARTGKLPAWLRAGEQSGWNVNEAKARAILEALLRTRNLKSSLTWVKRMQSLGLEPDAASYRSLTLAFAACQGGANHALSFFEQLVRAGGEQSPAIQRSVLAALARDKNATMVRSLFDAFTQQSLPPDSKTFTAIIAGFADAGESEYAEQWLRELDANSVPPKRSTIEAMVTAHANNASKTGVMRWLGVMKANDLQLGPSAHQALIRMHASLKDLAAAERQYRKMREAGHAPTPACYQALLLACVEAPDPQKAVTFFDSMLEQGIKSDRTSYDLMVRVHVAAGDLQEAGQWMRVMSNKGFKPTLLVYTEIIQIFADEGNVDRVRFYLMQIKRLAMVPDDRTYRLALQSCVVSRPVQPEMAKRLFCDMVREGVDPSEETLDVLRQSLGKKDAKALIAELRDQGSRRPEAESGLPKDDDPEQSARYEDDGAWDALKKERASFRKRRRRR